MKASRASGASAGGSRPARSSAARRRSSRARRSGSRWHVPSAPIIRLVARIRTSRGGRTQTRSTPECPDRIPAPVGSTRALGCAVSLLPTQCRLGVLAFGDSITNAGGELQWGVALQSWAMWVARGLALPFTGYAVDGARAADVPRDQIPAFERRTAAPGARYHLGCLYIGVNDVRLRSGWDREAFADDHSARARVRRRPLRADARRHRPAASRWCRQPGPRSAR